ncbi:Mu transposase C-terminal domain-containing protein [Schinkia azotoformans]|uniref:Mu transposase C-terminal domain-containing protein n=1 Tax=Schinkia azotoformans TaxID=1454 RepID=UPI002DB84CAC|nr:Mu transposase C-terminal domain-containing protein [Schinkia azotoformans]MEC1759895.1 DDE-type integrase/transposase/recombinase [Schinkia azotoformans]
MKFVENMLFQYDDGKMIRIIHISRFSSIIYVVELRSRKWPIGMESEEIKALLESSELKLVEEDPTLRIIDEEELSEAEKARRDKAWEIVSFVLKQVDQEEKLLITSYREKAIKETLSIFNVSYSSVKNYFLQYYQGGKTRNALLPKFNGCGARGKDRNASARKLGRPNTNNDRKGINIDENIKKIFKTGLNRYYYNDKQNSLKTAYELTLKDFFTIEQVDSKGVSIPILKNSSEIPSYRQFLYWYKKFNDPRKEVASRKGTRIYYQQYRSIIGDSTTDAKMGPASLWQIDSTVFDIYLVSSTNRDLIVGRPILFLVIDVFSRMIVGINVSFESLNSYVGAMMALYNSMTHKVDFCRKYGIEIDEKEWDVSCVPQRILADRGELVGKQIENAIESLGIFIQNSPPYRADYKGIIEQAFRQMNLKVKPFADGVVKNGKNKIERGDQDYRLKANLTIDEFTTIIIRCVLFHNNHHVLSAYVLNEMMLSEDVEKIPKKIWEYGIQNYRGQLRSLSMDTIRMYLFPTDEATVTARGIHFKKMYYASEYCLKNNWFQHARIKGSWRVKIWYDPRNLTNIFIANEEGNGFDELTLLSHLSKYERKSIEEIEVIQKQEQIVDQRGKEEELQEKIKLFHQLEQIVKEGKERTEIERDDSKSKKQRISGLKDNLKSEREFLRERDKQPIDDFSVEEFESDENNVDDLALFKSLREQE